MADRKPRPIQSRLRGLRDGLAETAGRHAPKVWSALRRTGRGLIDTLARHGARNAVTLAILLAGLLGAGLLYSSVPGVIETPTYRFAGGPKNSESIAVAHAIADVVNEGRPGFRLEVVATSGSRDSVARLGRLEVKDPTVGLPEELDESAAQTDEDPPVDFALVPANALNRHDLDLIALAYADTFQLLASEASGITGVADLEGRSIGVPPFASGQYRAFWFLAFHYALAPETMKVRTLGPRATIEAVADGTIEAVFVARALRNDLVRVLVTQHGMRMVPITQGPAMNLRRPELEASVIPAGTYLGAPPVPPDDLASLEVRRLLVARQGLPEAVGREITRVLFEERRRLVLREPLAGQIARPSLDGATVLAIQSGALAYYHRDEPGFLEEKAEFLAFLLSAMVLVVSLLLALRRYLAERRKGRVEDYTTALIRLEADAKTTRTIADLNVYKDQLSKILAQVVSDMNDERIGRDGAEFFAFVWQSVNDAVNDHEEQLRLGSRIAED